MSEQTNYNTQKISTQDAALCFGGISKDKAVISSFKDKLLLMVIISLRLDRRWSREKDGLHQYHPETVQVKAGLDLKRDYNISSSREW